MHSLICPFGFVNSRLAITSFGCIINIFQGFVDLGLQSFFPLTARGWRQRVVFATTSIIMESFSGRHTFVRLTGHRLAITMTSRKLVVVIHLVCGHI